MDLHDLMENNTDIDVLQLQHPNSTPELNFAPRKRKQSLTEMEWNSAFNTYTALYLEKYPHEYSHTAAPCNKSWQQGVIGETMIHVTDKTGKSHIVHGTQYVPT